MDKCKYSAHSEYSHFNSWQFPCFLYLFLPAYMWSQTTYSTCFLLYHLARNPDIQNKVFQETLSILPDYDNDEITVEHMTKHLNYSRAVLKETFRMNPVSVGVGRTTNTDLTLSGYNVPKGVSSTWWSLFRILFTYLLFARTKNWNVLVFPFYLFRLGLVYCADDRSYPEFHFMSFGQAFRITAPIYTRTMAKRHYK